MGITEFILEYLSAHPSGATARELCHEAELNHHMISSSNDLAKSINKICGTMSKKGVLNRTGRPFIYTMANQAGT